MDTVSQAPVQQENKKDQIKSAPRNYVPVALKPVDVTEMYRPVNPLATEFCKTTVGDVMVAHRMPNAPLELVVAQYDDEIGTVIERLGRNRIVGCPVLKSGRVIGMIEMRDIVLYLLAQYPDPNKVTKRDFETLMLEQRSLLKAQVVQLIELQSHERRTSMALPFNEPLISAAKIFANGYHRITVYDEQHVLKGILSQTDLTRFIYDKLGHGELKQMTNRTLKEYGYGRPFKVESIMVNQTVLQALTKMAATGVNALAVIHPETGALIGNFSATDLRGVLREQFPNLLQSVGDFLDQFSQKSLKPIVEPPETRSLLDTCKIMLENHVHHVWLVNDKKQPIGIISMTDVANIALNSKV